MDVSVQEQVKDLITALIRALGSSHAKLLTLLRTCPPGAEDLALRVLTIFTESGRPSAQLVALVKGLISERDLDARFLIPIIAEMDKVGFRRVFLPRFELNFCTQSDIVRYLPRIVSILNGQSEPKNLVRSVFGSIVTTPPQTFGSVTSNLPRARLNESLSPAELMVLLHESEKEIGLKSAIEGQSRLLALLHLSQTLPTHRSHWHLLLHDGCFPIRGSRRGNAADHGRTCAAGPFLADGMEAVLNRSYLFILSFP
jgi:symplekin